MNSESLDNLIELLKKQIDHNFPILARPELTNLYGDIKIGENVFVGPFVEIQGPSYIGDNTRIQSHSFICAYTDIGRNVFVGHGVMTCNDKNPKANNANWERKSIQIGDDCSIGSGAVLLPGISLGKGCVIGAGAVVTKSVPAGETWAGNPAKKL